MGLPCNAQIWKFFSWFANRKLDIQHCLRHNLEFPVPKKKQITLIFQNIKNTSPEKKDLLSILKETWAVNYLMTISRVEYVIFVVEVR